MKLQGSKEFNELRMKYTPYELSEFLMKEYITLGTYVQLEMKYNVNRPSIKYHINKHIEDVKYEKPYIYELYVYKNKYNKINKSNKPKKATTELVNERDKKKKLSLEHFKELPRKVSYDNLRDWALENFNTDKVTGEELIEMAQKQDIKVFEKYNGRLRYLFIKGGTVKWTYFSN